MLKAKQLCLPLFISIFFSLPVSAYQKEEVEDTIEKSIEIREQTQNKSAQWQSRKEKLKSRYYQLKDSFDAIDVEVSHMQEIVDRQNVYIARMENRIIEMEKIRQHLVPFLEEILDSMQETVDNDLPFLVQERATRISALRQVIHDPELSMGEKLRRVFESLRVEMDYGKSVETTKEEISFDGEEIIVKVLRLGRTALLMLTLDDSKAGIFSQGRWISLPGKYRGEIKKAIEITERRRPIEFVNLPVTGVTK